MPGPEQRPYDGYLVYALGDLKNPSKERVSGEGKKPHQATSRAAANFGRAPAKVTTAFGFHYGMPWKLT